MKRILKQSLLNSKERGAKGKQLMIYRYFGLFRSVATTALMMRRGEVIILSIKLRYSLSYVLDFFFIPFRRARSYFYPFLFFLNLIHFSVAYSLANFYID